MLFQLLRLTLYAFCRLYFRVEFRGGASVPREGRVIIAPNHVSYLDPIWVSLPLRRRLRYMAWDRLFSVPLLGRLIRALGSYPVKVESGDRAALRQSVGYLQAGDAVVIFPEGGRTRTGEIMPFKPGVIRLALDSGAPILPVTILGGFAAFSPWHRFPRPRKVTIIYHAPLTLLPPADPSEMKEYLRQQSTRLQRIVAGPLSIAASVSQQVQA